jgi:hypothetical protein
VCSIFKALLGYKARLLFGSPLSAIPAIICREAVIIISIIKIVIVGWARRKIIRTIGIVVI